MKVSECMTRDPRVASPNQPLRTAAHIMEEMDIGFLPVGENDRLVGVITDRDIAMRGVSRGHDGNTQIGDLMSGRVRYCFENDDVNSVLDNMGQLQVRRLVVLDQDKRLAGVVTIGDISRANNSSMPKTGAALCEISKNGTEHIQQGKGKGKSSARASS